MKLRSVFSLAGIALAFIFLSSESSCNSSDDSLGVSSPCRNPENGQFMNCEEYEELFGTGNLTNIEAVLCSIDNSQLSLSSIINHQQGNWLKSKINNEFHGGYADIEPCDDEMIEVKYHITSLTAAKGSLDNELYFYAILKVKTDLSDYCYAARDDYPPSDYLVEIYNCSGGYETTDFNEHFSEYGGDWDWDEFETFKLPNHQENILALYDLANEFDEYGMLEGEASTPISSWNRQ